MDVSGKFYELIRLSVDSSYDMPDSISQAEWPLIYEMAEKQSLCGILYKGIMRLTGSKMPPEKLREKWFVKCYACDLTNHKAYVAVAHICKWLKEQGYRCCILKGQGNSLMYNDRYSRSVGDIDVWVEGGYKKVLKFARKYCNKNEICYHHIEFNDFEGFPVEIHYRPSFINNMIGNRYLQKYFTRHSNEQFANYKELPDNLGSVCVPTADFNRIFQLTHIVRHFFQGGIGMRQIMDYYFVLKQGFTAQERDRDVKLIHRMGLYNIARSVMYVEQRVLGLDRKYILVEPDPKTGNKMLTEIMKAGNFGHFDNRRLRYRNAGKITRGVMNIYRNASFMFKSPSECFWEPIFRIYHFLWRKVNT